MGTFPRTGLLPLARRARTGGLPLVGEERFEPADRVLQRVHARPLPACSRLEFRDVGLRGARPVFERTELTGEPCLPDSPALFDQGDLAIDPFGQPSREPGELSGETALAGYV